MAKHQNARKNVVDVAAIVETDKVETLRPEAAALEAAKSEAVRSEAARSETEADTDTGEDDDIKVSVEGKTVTIIHKWRKDKTVPTSQRQAHKVALDFEGTTEEELLVGFAKGIAIPKVKEWLKAAAKAGQTITEQSFSKVNVKADIIAATRGSKVKLTPEQEMRAFLVKQNKSPQEIEEFMRLFNKSNAPATN